MSIIIGVGFFECFGPCVALVVRRFKKPNRLDEMERVEGAGGWIVDWHSHGVLGVLATSRSLGDYDLKPFVISKSELMVIDRTEEDDFLILASDGL